MATTAEERMQILRMIEQKQVSAADGAKLLEALRAGANDARPIKRRLPRLSRAASAPSPDP